MAESDTGRTIRKRGRPIGQVKPDDAWQAGRVILDSYVLVRKLGSGGMGTVYLAERQLTSGTLRFAVKTLPDRHAQDSSNKIALLRELRTWMDLPEHPHIAACRFFRTIGNRLAIFSEYIDGGSLEDWIQKDRMTGMEKILDTAVQIAWGLHASHTRNVIHQDVKPSNILMSADGTAKITDFGLSRLKGGGRVSSRGDGVQTILVTGGGYTPAYCSPEQISGEPVSRRTDVWSWGVTLLHMLTGNRSWQLGAAAPNILEHILTGKIPPLPDGLPDILRKCFEIEPGHRWPSLESAATALIGVIENLTGQPYHRRPPVYPDPDYDPQELTQNRPTGTIRTSREWLERVHDEQPETFGFDPATNENPEPMTRFSRRLLDLEIFELAAEGLQSLINSGRSDLESELADLLADKVIVHERIGDFPGALGLCNRSLQLLALGIDRNDDLNRQIRKAEMLALKGRISMRLNEYAGAEESYRNVLTILGETDMAEPGNTRLHLQIQTLGNLAYCLLKQKRYDVSDQVYDRAIALVESPGCRSERPCREELAYLIENKALLAWMRGYPDTALALHEKAHQIWSDLNREDPGSSIRFHMASTRSNRALVLYQTGHATEALAAFQEAAGVLESIDQFDSNLNIMESLAVIRNNIALAAIDTGQVDIASDALNRAAQLLNRLFYREGRSDMGSELARNLVIEAGLHRATGEYSKSIELYDRGIAMIEQMIYRDDRRDQYPELIRFLWEKGVVEHKSGDAPGALATYDRALEMLDHAVKNENMTMYRADAAWINLYRSEALHFLGRCKEAVMILKKSHRVIIREKKRTGRGDLGEAVQFADELSRRFKPV
ncbi:protein kinase [bacterium]|nr:protein kinase [candidate division CSSED10-310 bacterium]